MRDNTANLPDNTGKTYPRYKSRLKDWRKRRKISQDMLAEELGVSRGTVRNWENHGTIPTYKHRKRLQQFINDVETVPFPAIVLFHNFEI